MRAPSHAVGVDLETIVETLPMPVQFARQRLGETTRSAAGTGI